MVGRKRKQYIIDRRLQFSIVGTFLLTVVLALVLFTALTVGYYWLQGMAGSNVFKEYITIFKQTTVEQEIEEDGLRVTRQFPATKEIPGVKRWELVLPPLLFNNLVILMMIVIMGIIYSHRIAGPLYRIEKDLGRVLAGERNVKIVTRKHDKMTSLVDRVNEVIAEFNRIKEQDGRLL
jgi:methyl-accepting chemotaxis protein